MSLDRATGRSRRPLVPPPASQARPPGVAWDVVERRSLLGTITRSVEGAPLTLVRAPAGTGKTVLVADWSRRHGGGRPVAWLTVTERDNQAAVFWTHLHLALALVGAATADLALRPMFPDEADIDALCTRILQLAAPVVLVIDAAEKLTARTAYDQVRRLIDAGSDRFRVVLCSRVEPPLSLHRYRLENRVREIGADDLALGRDEVGQVLGQHGLAPSPELTGRVLTRTEGWAAGVRLAAIELATDGPDARLDGFAAPYVRAEVVARLTAAERDVLAATAVVDELDPGLAPALTDRADADDLLRTMSSGNAYVLPLRDRPGVLRLHPLVRELLLADLERAAPERAAALHRRAAAWYDARGRLEPAVRHLAAAGDWPAAAARMVEGRGLAEVVVGTRTGTTLATELAGLPETDSADVAVLRAAIALRDGDLDRARAALDRADPATSGSSLVVAERLQSDVRFPRNRITVYGPDGRKSRSYLVPLRGYITQLDSVDGDLLLSGSFKRTAPNGGPRNTAMLRLDVRSAQRRPWFDPHIHGPVDDMTVGGHAIFASGLFTKVHEGLDQDRDGLTKMFARSDKSEEFDAGSLYAGDWSAKARVVGDLLWVDRSPQFFADTTTGELADDPTGGLVRTYLNAVTGDADTLVAAGDWYTSGLAGEGYLQVGYVAAFPH